MRTAHARGIVCVAVFSEPDVDELFVAEADLAVALTGVSSAQTHLDQQQLLGGEDHRLRCRPSRLRLPQRRRRFARR